MPTSVFGARSKKSFRVVTIIVPAGGFLLYNLRTVRVCQGNYSIYRFEGIETLQVYNRADGYLTFYETAGIRQFPGLGRYGD